jgi:integral membrane protein
MNGSGVLATGLSWSMGSCVKNPIWYLRRIALVEAVSFLVLLGIAMPLKYVWDMPAAVLVVGWVHGLLFILFSAALLMAMRAAQWSLQWSVVVFVAALLPFGPFFVDPRLAAYEEEYLKQRPMRD